MIPARKFSFGLNVCLLIICLSLITAPAAAFTAESLTITVDKTGNATAEFRFTLEGFVENAIPESVLEEELRSGLSTSDEPPDVIAFDKSAATLLMKRFALVSDTDTGTEYITGYMNFSKAEEALKSSAVSSVISADFTPQKTTVIFPDGYKQEYTDSAVLPSIRHTVTDPAKQATRTPIKTAISVARTTQPVAAQTSPAAGGSSSVLVMMIMVLAVLALLGGGAYYYYYHYYEPPVKK